MCDQKREMEQLYFINLSKVNSLCESGHPLDDNITLADDIYNLTDELIYYKGHYKFLYDYNTLYSKNSLILNLILMKKLIVDKSATKNDRLTSNYMIDTLKGLRANNHEFAQKLISDIVNYYLKISIST
ncbi:hypothetical protein, partial [Aeromonas hydrophila]|uniref:hypothetical protein n=1 Tax=Aeromonas hydrophila TaxID=644 RepID=UPI001624C912